MILDSNFTAGARITDIYTCRSSPNSRPSWRANEALLRYWVTFRFSPRWFALSRKRAIYSEGSLTRRIFGMWIDYGIKLVRTKCIQFQDASVSIEASHAPNQISPASNQTFAVYIGPVIIDRSLMAKIYKNLVEHPRDSKLNIDPANKFSYSSIHVSYNQHRMKSFRDIIPKILRKLL